MALVSTLVAVVTSLHPVSKQSVCVCVCVCPRMFVGVGVGVGGCVSHVF